MILLVDLFADMRTYCTSYFCYQTRISNDLVVFQKEIFENYSIDVHFYVQLDLYHKYIILHFLCLVVNLYIKVENVRDTFLTS